MAEAPKRIWADRIPLECLSNWKQGGSIYVSTRDFSQQSSAPYVRADIADEHKRQRDLLLEHMRTIEENCYGMAVSVARAAIAACEGKE